MDIVTRWNHIVTYADGLIMVANNHMEYLNVMQKQYLIRDIELSPEYYLGKNIEGQVNGT